jgi:hypothetical protein
MAQKIITLGTSPDGMDGDDARTAFGKTNDNFTELYQGIGSAQPANPKLSAIAGSVWLANRLLITTGADTLAMLATGVTGRALIAAADAAAGRAALALGTAASLDVTTSALDQTAGRLLKKGDFGLGGLVPSEPDGSWYGTRFKQWAGSAPDRPPTAAIAVGFDSGYADNRRAQLAISLGDASAKAYIRGVTSAATSGNFWRELLIAGDRGIGGQAPGLADAAAINALGPNDQGFFTIVGSIAGALGIPKSYGGLIMHYGRAGDTAAQHYCSTGTTDVTTGYRTYNTVSAGWSPWVMNVRSLDLVSSNGDTAVGKVLTTGFMGLGARVGFNLGSANSASYNGFYQGAGAGSTNYPGSTAYGSMLVMSRDNAVISQLAMFGSAGTGPEAYVRGSSDNAATWSGWGKLFHSLNTVGTVSQSGGVPTGAIVERGSNANGQYTKWADGTLEQWGTFTTPSLATGPDTPQVSNVVMPISFVNTSFTPVASATPASTWAGADGVISSVPGDVNYFILNIRNRTTTQQYIARWRAIGRWF